MVLIKLRFEAPIRSVEITAAVCVVDGNFTSPACVENDYVARRKSRANQKLMAASVSLWTEYKHATRSGKIIGFLYYMRTLKYAKSHVSSRHQAFRLRYRELSGVRRALYNVVDAAESVVIIKNIQCHNLDLVD